MYREGNGQVRRRYVMMYSQYDMEVRSSPITVIQDSDRYNSEMWIKHHQISKDILFLMGSLEKSFVGDGI